MDLIKNDNSISKPILMNKNTSRNFKYLSQLGRNARDDAKQQVGKVLELCQSRKISQMQTAENAIMKLISKDPRRNLLIKL